MRRAVQLRRLEQPDVIGLILVAHECVDVPGRWRRPPGRVLRGDDDIEALPQVEHGLASLQPLGGIQEGTMPDAKRALGLLCREDHLASGEQAAHIT